MKFVLVLISSFFILSLSFSQDIRQDDYVSQINKYQVDIVVELQDYEPEVFTYSYCNRYVNEQGDTVKGKNCGGREIIFFSVGNKLVKVVDKRFGFDSLEYKSATEFLIKNDSLVQVLHSYRAELKSTQISLEESRVFFYSNRPYYHVAKFFKGDKNKEFSFYDTPYVLAPSDKDVLYIKHLEELVFHYTHNKMAVYKEELK